jgi:hypothetical protein
MRLLIYIASLVATVFALQFVFRMLLFAALARLGPIAWLPSIFSGALIYGAIYLPYSLLCIRAFIWFKKKRISAPASFRGFPYVVACTAAALVAVTVLGYVVLVFAGSGQGLSGVPLGMLLMLCGVVLALAMPFVEVRDWLSFLRERRAGEAKEVAFLPTSPE